MKKTAFFKRFIGIMMVCAILCCISVPAMAAENTVEKEGVEAAAARSFYLDVYGDARGDARGTTNIPGGWHDVYFSATTSGVLYLNYKSGSGFSTEEFTVTSAGGQARRCFDTTVVEWLFVPTNQFVSYSYSFIVD